MILAKEGQGYYKSECAGSSADSAFFHCAGHKHSPVPPLGIMAGGIRRNMLSGNCTQSTLKQLINVQFKF